MRFGVAVASHLKVVLVTERLSCGKCASIGRNSRFLVSVAHILLMGGAVDIIESVRPDISKTRHDQMIYTNSAPLPATILLPPFEPFNERHVEGDSPSSCAMKV